MGVLSAELSYVCFAKLNVAASIAPSLYTAQKPAGDEGSQPITIIKADGAQNLEHDKETQDRLRKMQLLTDAGWQYLDWSSGKKVLMLRAGEAAVSMADTQQLIEDLRQLTSTRCPE